MTEFWSVPRMWEGETVACIGGGPSLLPEHVNYLKGKCKVIVINNSYKLAPWADILYFCDHRWYTWHEHDDDFKAFKGMMVTLNNLDKVPNNILKLENLGSTGLTDQTTGLKTGSNSGYQCINLATLLGANKILLLAYDMKHGPSGQTHWHKGHYDNINNTRVVMGNKVFERNMLPKFHTLVQPLNDAGIEVINCSMGSAITVFPKVELKDAI